MKNNNLLITTDLHSRNWTRKNKNKIKHKHLENEVMVKKKQKSETSKDLLRILFENVNWFSKMDAEEDLIWTSMNQ